MNKEDRINLLAALDMCLHKDAMKDAHKLIENYERQAIAEHDSNFKLVIGKAEELCSIITNSDPNTLIKGYIESLAFELETLIKLVKNNKP